MFIIPEIGSTVFLRQRQYVIEDVIAPNAPITQDSTHIVTLSCIDDDAQGQQLKVIWEKEFDKVANFGEDWSDLSSRTFDDPQVFSAYYHNLNWNSITSTDPELFQAPFRSGIKIEPYQLEPLWKALKLPRVNLFIADDVGLGKTIEAALIARELLIRKKVKDIVICAPPSMLFQWKEELETRFGLIFEIMDKNYISKVRQERGWSVNPWETNSRFLVSHRMLIDDEYTSLLRDWLTEFRGRSMLILDEAHHAAPASDGSYAISSQFTKAIQNLAPRFEHKLFLSATPHNGHSNSFSTLLSILDPNRFYASEKIKDPSLIDDILVRRLKEDLRELVPGFPNRKVEAIAITEDHWPEIKLSKLLQDYKDAKRERLAAATIKQKESSGFVLVGLQKRLLSSPEAFFKTLRVHKLSFEKALKEKISLKEINLKDFELITSGVDQDSDLADLEEDKLEKIENSMIETLTEQSSIIEKKEALQKEHKVLIQMMTLAEKARYQSDGKVTYLIKWIEENLCKNKKSWNDDRVIIFTEYEDTKNYIKNQLEQHFENQPDFAERLAVFHGPTSMEKRNEIKRLFNENPAKNKLRILLTTDAAREGLNLQTHCWNLFHYDIPWNPSRLEQRNGRIDRKLQPKPEVFCRYFQYVHRSEDKVLSTLIEKTEIIRNELGSLSQVLDNNFVSILKRGIDLNEITNLQESINSTDINQLHKQRQDRELEAIRGKDKEKRKQKISENIKHMTKLLEKSKKWIAMEDEYLMSALNCSLKMSKLPQLKPTDLGLVFPDVTSQMKDSSWQVTLDTLRPTKKRDQKPAEWRAETTFRPVVFHDQENSSDEKVHLHLEHRLVRRLLSKFSSQGFVKDGLSRFCIIPCEVKSPRAVLLTRLLFFSKNGAGRLHEEIIPISGRWGSVKDKTHNLTIYKEDQDAEKKTLIYLQEAILKSDFKKIAVNIAKEHIIQDFEKLGDGIREKLAYRWVDVQSKLKERAEAEANSLKKLLEDQLHRIKIELGLAEEKLPVVIANSRQMSFDGVESTEQLDLAVQYEQLTQREKAQVEAERKELLEKIERLKQEINEEPDKVRKLYEHHTPRIEKLGLVYLWPQDEV
jgi:ERCC4-related helicase